GFGAAGVGRDGMVGVRAGGQDLRNFLHDAGLVLLLTLLLFLASVMTAIFQWFQEYFLQAIGVPWIWLYWLAVAFSLSLSTAMFYFAYRYVPRRRPRPSAALTGALLTALPCPVPTQPFPLSL